MSKAQVTLFVIVGILIVSSGILFAYFQTTQQLPAELKSVEDFFSTCVSGIVNDAAAIAGEQSGYVALPEVVPGSDYAPFSSQFFFLGSKVPYWFYMSGNGIQLEQIPTLDLMQKQMADYIKTRISECSFDSFAEQGYNISTENVSNVKVTIMDNSIVTEITYPVNIRKGDVARRVELHSTGTSSSLGRLYSDAKRIYDYEKNLNFLEKYSMDSLTLNAPTTDVVISCAPKAWSQLQVESDVKNSLEANIQTIKVQGNYYQLRNDKYFVQDILVSEQVNFMYSIQWPSVFEVWPSQDGVMEADPVGLQEGLGALGFCYVPYHFVYSLRFPVMIQLMDGDELFQFPVVVIIDRNQPKKANVSETPESIEAEMCKNKVQEVSVNIMDSNLNPENATISFICHNALCTIGTAGESGLTANFPQCINGFIVASAPGYKTTKFEVSTNEPASVDIIMPKLYDFDARILADSSALSSDDSAIIQFISNDYSYSLYWPVQKSIRLAEGSYNVTAFIFKQGNITLEAQTKRQCTKAPATGVLGFFGIQTENCFDLTVPQQTLTQIVSGGGNANIAFSEDDLKSAKAITISVPQTKTPASILEMQTVYDTISTNQLKISLG